MGLHSTRKTFLRGTISGEEEGTFIRQMPKRKSKKSKRKANNWPKTICLKKES